MFNEESSFIYIKPSTSFEEYKTRKVEVGYEIIDNSEDGQREISILEHVYGVADKKETC